MPNPSPFMLCADDYAISPGVSRGILEALDAGRLSATSAMTNRPTWPAAARDLAPLATRADLGVHLTLTAGAPLAAMPLLAPTGVFPGIGAIVRGAVLRQLPEMEVRAEIKRQLDAFEDETGRAPDFVDGHQHVQILPGVRRWLIEEMARRGWAGKVWLRDSSDGLAAIWARRVEAAKAAQVAILATGFAGAAEKAGFETNRGFSGFSAFNPARSFQVDFERFLIQPGPRHLVMCHPGHADLALAEVDDVGQTRELELKFLLSGEFLTVMATAGARIKRWERGYLTQG